MNGLKVYPPRWPTIYKGEITYFDMGWYLDQVIKINILNEGQIGIMGLWMWSPKTLQHHLDLFCLVMHNMNQIMRKHLTNQNWGAFYKIFGLGNSKTSISWKTKLKNCSKLKKNKETTQCTMWSWSGQLIKCDKGLQIRKKKDHSMLNFQILIIILSWPTCLCPFKIHPH